MTAPALDLPVIGEPHPEATLRITVHAHRPTTETHRDIPATWDAICALTRLGFRVTVQPLD